MSIKVTNWVWAKSESRNGARLVMLALADRADDKGFAWPSIEDICERAKLSPRAVQKGIAKLVEIGELKVESGGGRRVRNRYQIVPKPRTSDGVTLEETPSFATETPHFATETPSFEHGNPVKSAGEPPLEPSEEPSGNHHNYPAAVDDRLPAVRKSESDGHPAWVVPLKDAMSAAGINTPWKFRGDDLLRLHNDVQRLGIPLMVGQALKAERAATEPPFSSRWFYDGWHAMHTPIAIGGGPTDGSNVVAIRAQGRPLPGTDTTVAGWDALAAELRAKENPA